MDVLTMKGKALLLGNEAIVRGALESGISFAAAYPGTPSSEIADTFSEIAKKYGMYFEYSVNEKVSLEVCAAASLSGLRALTCMKHVGLNVASDPLMTYAYIGCRAGHIIVTADDPSCHSSQNEQDNRYYALFANLPMLEPSNPQECKDMTMYGFNLSEELGLPVILRTTTRISHTRGVVELGQLKTPKPRGTGNFEKDPMLVTVPSVARAKHPELLKKMEKAMEFSDWTPFNKVIDLAGRDSGRIGIITSGISYCYVHDAVKDLGIGARILKLGFTNPIPKKKCIRFLESCDKVIVVEELEPYLEEQMKSLAYEVGAKTRIFGKGTGHFPRTYEYNQDVVIEGIKKVLGLAGAEAAPETGQILSRPAVLCPGCPHRATYYAVKLASRGKDVVYPNDIGCYTLGRSAPFNAADLLLCMGSSAGTACGLSAATNKHIVAFIGDSTFFHAGISPLINGVHNKHRFVLAILDNRTTAMTGHQPHPGIDRDGMGEEAPAIQLEPLVKGCGVEFVKTVDPYNLKETIQVFKEALEYPKVSTVISKRECALRVKKKEEYYVDQETCKKCNVCINQFACPAFYLEGDEVRVDGGMCMGCGVCAQVCPFGSIKRRE